MGNTSSTIVPDLDAHIREHIARWTVPGVVVGVLHDGERAIRAYGVTSLETGCPVRPDTLFPIGSIGKVYTAALVMTLVDDGMLDLDVPIVAYLPDLQLADERARDAITLRHLLTHQSGLFGDYYDDFGMGDDALARCVASFTTLRQLTTPGELWAYCSSGFMLAGRVVEVVTGQSFEAAMRRRILDPLGLDHSFLYAHEAIVYPTAAGHVLTTPDGDEHEVSRRYLLPRNVAPAGGIVSDVGDLLSFAAFFMGDGTWGGRHVLSQTVLEAMQAPQVRAAGYLAAGFSEWGGLGWAVHDIDGVKVVEHGGSLSGFQVKLKFIPERQLAVAILTNSARGGVLGDRVAEWMFDNCIGLEASRSQPISLPDEALARFAGRYRYQDEEVTLTVEDGGLRSVITIPDPTSGQEQTYPPELLRPIAEREFVVVTRNEHEGARADCIIGDGGSIRFLRMDGRLYDRVGDEVEA